MNAFCRYELRTTDAAGARAFYARLLGHERAMIWPLHEQALARGARPHWLGQIEVADLESATSAFIERGAAPLGPVRPSSHGGRVAVLRDPGGALVGLTTPLTASARADAEGSVSVVWHVLNTDDAARAATNYGELFGWAMGDRFEVAGQGVSRPFSWHPGAAGTGLIADVAGRPGVHPHWLFFFEVEALERAIALTRAAGGVVLDPISLPSGERICVCDDPQGAAFALRERRAP